MTLTTILALVIIASGLAILKRYRASRAIYVCSLIIALAVGCGPVPIYLLTNLQSAYDINAPLQWEKRNAIVLLGVGTEKIPANGRTEASIFSYGRIVKAVVLYNACRKKSDDCRVIVSGGDVQNHGVSEASIYSLQLRELGVPITDIVLEERSVNTWQNAQFTSTLLKQHEADRVLLVSTGIHLRRSQMYFAHFGIDTTPVRADYLSALMSLLPATYNFTVADFAIHEYVGIARYHVYNALGWNLPAVRPRSS